MSDKQPVGIRRIVTGHDERGTAVIIEDGPTPGVKTTPNRPGVIFHNMWINQNLHKNQNIVRNLYPN